MQRSRHRVISSSFSKASLQRRADRSRLLLGFQLGLRCHNGLLVSPNPVSLDVAPGYWLWLTAIFIIVIVAIAIKELHFRVNRLREYVRERTAQDSEERPNKFNIST